MALSSFERSFTFSLTLLHWSSADTIHFLLLVGVLMLLLATQTLEEHQSDKNAKHTYDRDPYDDETRYDLRKSVCYQDLIRIYNVSTETYQSTFECTDWAVWRRHQ